MKKIQTPYKKIGDTNEKKIVVIQKWPGVPGNRENAKGDDNRECFGEIVKKEVIVKAAHVQPSKNQQAKKEITESLFHFQIDSLSKPARDRFHLFRVLFP